MSFRTNFRAESSGLVLASMLCCLASGAAFAQALEVRPVSGASPFGFAVEEPVAPPFPADLWRGSSSRDAEGVLADLRIPANSRAGLDLLVRAIASPGTEPANAGQATGAARMEALYALGRVADAARGLGRIRSVAETPAGRRLAAELKLLAGDDAGACAAPGLELATAAPATSTPAELSPAEQKEARFVARLRLFCAAIGGDGSAANSAIARLKALGVSGDWAEAAANRLLKRGPAKTALAPRFEDAVDYRLVEALGLARTVTMINRAPLPLLRVMLDDPKTPDVVRAAVIERALRQGLLSGAEARRKALVMAGFAANAGFLRNRTLLLDLATVTGQPAAAQGEAVANILIKPRPYAEFAALSTLLAPEIASVRIDTGNAALGAPLARAALSAGDLANARKFFRLAVGAGGVAKDDPDIGRLGLALALATFAAENGSAEARQMLITAAQARFDAAAAIGAVPLADAVRDCLLVAGAAGLGLAELDLPAEAIDASPTTSGPGPFQRIRLGDAVRRGAKAETAILAAGLGDIGPTLAPVDAWTTLSALSRLGLASEASALGVEWLLAGVKL